MKKIVHNYDPQFLGEVIETLLKNGYETTLIGGVALILMGSQRVTKDVDLVIRETAREEHKLFDLLYTLGFELISRVDKKGEVVRTVDNVNVAFAKTQIDKPKSIFFYHDKAELRIDLLFDFPFPAEEMHQNAKQKKIQNYIFHIASKADLIRMKKIAYENRKKSTDLQDLEFLKSL